VFWQERVDGWPQIRAYKQRIGELVAGCDPVLDVGCGPGVDAAARGMGAVGVDRSAVMCAAAAARGVAVARADAHALPFAREAFGAVVADRVLQHLADPDTALRQLAEVVRHGGRVVLAEPDQETLVISVPGIDRSVTDRIKALRRDLGYRNGRLASTLPARLAAVGLVDVAVDAFALSLTDPDLAFGLPKWPYIWQDAGRFTDAELAAWDAAMGRARAHGLVYAVTYLVVSARHPGDEFGAPQASEEG
jgi:SAM-dependent methyltransferase